MKRILIVGVVLSFSACASMQDKDSNMAPKLSEKPSESRYNDAYVARVNNEARLRGIAVYWLNPPQAPRTEKDERDD